MVWGNVLAVGDSLIEDENGKELVIDVFQMSPDLWSLLGHIETVLTKC